MEALIDPQRLMPKLHNPEWVIVDVRSSLHDREAGRRKWIQMRIPGAIHLDLERDFSSVGNSKWGRHPLPSPEKFAARLQELGIGEGQRLVVYDDVGGAIAARLWWMMRWLRGLPVAVLDGGIDRWLAEGKPIATGRPSDSRDRRRAAFRPSPCDAAWVSLEEVMLLPTGCLLLDARSRERFRGESEPIDPRAGHIPGAVSAPFEENLTYPDRRFKSRRELLARFTGLGVTEADSVICYCGSGVTACHNLLALELAGLPSGRLFVGSWSQWCHCVAPSSEETFLGESDPEVSNHSISSQRRPGNRDRLASPIPRQGG